MWWCKEGMFCGGCRRCNCILLMVPSTRCDGMHCCAWPAAAMIRDGVGAAVCHVTVPDLMLLT
jgi:hypothetical protein